MELVKYVEMIYIVITRHQIKCAIIVQMILTYVKVAEKPLKMRTRPKSEQVFYDTLKRLIENQLINDPNFKGKEPWSQSWYEKNNKLHYGLFVEKANYILEEIEGLKHLILEDE